MGNLVSQVVAAPQPASTRSGSEVAKGGVEIGLEMQEVLEAHQFHGLHHASIADHQKLLLVGVALLGQLHQGPQARGVDEVDMAQIDHQGLPHPAVGGDEVAKLLIGVGIQLAGEPEQLAVGLLLEAPSQ